MPAFQVHVVKANCAFCSIDAGLTGVRLCRALDCLNIRVKHASCSVTQDAWFYWNGPRPLCPNPVHFGMKGNGLVSPRIFGWAERDSSYFRTFDKQKEIARARYHQGKQQKQIGFVYRKCNWSRLYPTNLYH